jgi:uncharacterized protein YbbC (DUF1343 family)
VSVGRGTGYPFACYGFPNKKNFDFEATPVDVPGKVTDPPHENVSCGFVDLREDCSSLTQINLSYLIDAYTELGDAMFNSPVFFDKLAGTKELRIQLKLHLSANDIRKSWERGLQDYLSLRKKYLMYP